MVLHYRMMACNIHVTRKVVIGCKRVGDHCLRQSPTSFLLKLTIHKNLKTQQIRSHLLILTSTSRHDEKKRSWLSVVIMSVININLNYAISSSLKKGKSNWNTIFFFHEFLKIERSIISIESVYTVRKL